jgi:hypothetical protein
VMYSLMSRMCAPTPHLALCALLLVSSWPGEGSRRSGVNLALTGGMGYLDRHGVVAQVRRLAMGGMGACA